MTLLLRYVHLWKTYGRNVPLAPLPFVSALCVDSAMPFACIVHRPPRARSRQPILFDWCCCRVRSADSVRRNGFSRLLLSMSHTNTSTPFPCIVCAQSPIHLHRRASSSSAANGTTQITAHLLTSRRAELLSRKQWAHGIVGTRLGAARRITFDSRLCIFVHTLHTSLHARLHLRSNKMESVWSVLRHRQK